MVAFPLCHLLIAPLLLFAACTRRARTRLKTDSVPPERGAEMKKLFCYHPISTQHKRSKKKRKEKREIGRFQPYTVLRILYKSNLPEPMREALAALLPNFAGSYGGWKYLFQTNDRIADMIWKHLPEETNPVIRRPLMHLANGKFEGDPGFATWRGYKQKALPFVLDILNQDSMRYDEREAACEMLAGIIKRWAYHNNFDVNPVLAIWRRLLVKHRDPLPFSDRLLASAVRCARHLIWKQVVPVRMRVYPPVLLWYAADQATMDFLFESILSDSAPLQGEPCLSDRLRNRSSAFIASVLGRLPAAERATFVRRYGVQLRQAVTVMHPEHLAIFARHNEFLDIIATTPSALINVWEGGARHRCNGFYLREMPLSETVERCRKHELANVIFRCLRHALADPPRLQSMLGEGLIAIAHHFASDEFDTSPDVANVFRRILALHPELEPRFKSIARFGCATNETAILARSLTERPCKVGWYIFNEEVESSSSEEDSEADSDDHNDETSSEESDGSDEDSNESSSSDSHDEDVDGESSRSQDSDDME